MTLHLEILSESQKEVLEKLGFLESFSCYLVGGTALAIQLGHRTSLDLDFYIREKFSSKKITQNLSKLIKKTEFDADQPEGTLQGYVQGVNFSLFHYDYPLIRPLVDFPPIKLVSLEDISAMKVAAIIQRAKQRDFFDMYYLIKKLGLGNIITAAYAKYPWYEENNQIIFKALMYFDEADHDAEISAIRFFDKDITWSRIKKEITKEVKIYLSPP